MPPWPGPRELINLTNHQNFPSKIRWTWTSSTWGKPTQEASNNHQAILWLWKQNKGRKVTQYHSTVHHSRTWILEWYLPRFTLTRFPFCQTGPPPYFPSLCFSCYIKIYHAFSGLKQNTVMISDSGDKEAAPLPGVITMWPRTEFSSGDWLHLARVLPSSVC